MLGICVQTATFEDSEIDFACPGSRDRVRFSVKTDQQTEWLQKKREAEDQEEIRRLAEFKQWKIDYQAHLKPATSFVLAAGFSTGDSFKAIGVAATEDEIIPKIWSRIMDECKSGQPVVGHGLITWMLPYLVLRSNIIGAEVPRGIYGKRQSPEWHRSFVDTELLWRLGREECDCRFNTLCHAFGNEPVDETIDFPKTLAEESATAFEFMKAVSSYPIEWLAKMS